MPSLNKGILFFIALALFACKEKKDYIYEVNELQTQSQTLQKGTLKTEEQYISILYANLFQKALSANELVEITNLIEACGDKETIHEVIISSFMNSPDKIIPTDAAMRADLPKFMEETYRRFLVRSPSEAEKTWFINFVGTNDKVSPELVYMAFALSNEYQYY